MTKSLYLLLAFVILICSFDAIPSEARAGISFEKRLAAQKAIEEVYWKHSLWPEDNPQPKPALKEVMPDSVIRLKTERYLRKSYALDAYFQRPITAKQLQAEIDRMAKETQNPEMLSELWDALQNDPLLIAECLARPLLIERSANRISGFERRWQRFKRRTEIFADIPSHHYYLPSSIIRASSKSIPLYIPEDYWSPITTTGAPTGRWGHTAVWTGTRMIIWGGFDNTAYPVNSGGQYDPTTNSWSTMSVSLAPAARWSHTAVWTGTHMIAWGGLGIGSTQLNTGGKYDPFLDRWNSITTTAAPSARAFHTAVWTGTKMIVWGGSNSSIDFNTGGRYDPSANSWTSTLTHGAPSPRAGHTAVWTGQEMIVWGRDFESNTGGRYNPVNNLWTPTSTFLAPVARENHTAVWTGNVMIIWGGNGYSGLLNSGSRYNPATNSWAPTTTSGVPSARSHHTAVWAGNKGMIIWGGRAGGVNPIYLNTGSKYDPVTDSWNATTTSLAPSERILHTAVWNGDSEFGGPMIIWGGQGESGLGLNTGGRYNTQ